MCNRGDYNKIRLIATSVNIAQKTDKKTETIL